MLSYGSNSSPPSDSDDHWMGLSAAQEPSLTGEIIGRGSSFTSSNKQPTFTVGRSFFESNNKPSFTLGSRSGLEPSKSIRIPGRTGRTISSSSSSSDGGMATFTQRLCISETKTLPKINVVSAASVPAHRIRIATAL